MTWGKKTVIIQLNHISIVMWFTRIQINYNQYNHKYHNENGLGSAVERSPLVCGVLHSIPARAM